MTRTFAHYEVRTREGEVIEIKFEVASGRHGANVLLMDEDDFEAYRYGGRNFEYGGGWFEESPAILRPPGPGRWQIVVDRGGRPGLVKASFAVVGG